MIVQDCKKDKASNITIDLVDDNPFHLIGRFPGPIDTPYEGGHFAVVSLPLTQLSTQLMPHNCLGYCHTGLIPISTSEDEVYNVRTPRVSRLALPHVVARLPRKVYHPNISSASGAICLDILKDAWSPVLTLKSTLISLQSLLCSPEPNDPQDAEGVIVASTGFAPHTNLFSSQWPSII